MNIFEQTASILILESDEDKRKSVVNFLCNEGYQIREADCLEEAADIIRQDCFDVLIAQQQLLEDVEGRGWELVNNNFDAQNVVLLFNKLDATQIHDHMHYGALLVEPYSFQQLRKAVTSASHGQPYTDKPEEDDLGLVGVSQYILDLRKSIRRIAPGDFPVLILGHSGTGKEVVAKAIHNASKRSNRSIVTVNCGAIPKHLEESELFGHTKGAFTGAHASKEGIIANADNSTLFLDEIGETSLETQSMLLRVLDVGEFTPIGKTMPQKVNIRILSATNRNLEEMVEAGTFRKDLYFRLKGVVIETVPLMEHKDDIAPLVEYFLKDQDNPELPVTLSSPAFKLLESYQWPGNIRELKYTIEVLSVAAIGKKTIDVETVTSVLNINPSLSQGRLPYNEAKAKVLSEFELQYFSDLLKETEGNVSQAARMAGMHRPNLKTKLKNLKIDVGAFRH